MQSLAIAAILGYIGSVTCLNWVAPKDAADRIGVSMTLKTPVIKFENLAFGTVISVAASGVNGVNANTQHKGYLEFKGTDQESKANTVRFNFIDASTGYQVASFAVAGGSTSTDAKTLEGFGFNKEFQSKFQGLLTKT